MSFRFKTILGVAIIEGILLLVLIFSSLQYLQSSNEQELLKRSYTTAKLFATTTKSAVLSTDLASIESFVREVLTNPDIVYARVRDQDTVLFQGGDKEAISRPFKADKNIDSVNDGIFDAYADIKISGVNYGRVEIGISIDAYQKILSEARLRTLIIASVEMGLVALFSFVLGTYLTRGLNALKLGSNHLAQGDLGYQIKIKGKDELAQTAKAFNEMSKDLLAASEEGKRAEIQILKLNQNLENRVKQRTQELEKLNEQLEHQALHDSLTNLANRSLLHDRLEHQIHTGQRENIPFALAIIDLDRFKQINDTMGHFTGDQVLQKVSFRLNNVLRKSDTIARMGGDEFAMILPTIGDERAANIVMEKIHNALSAPISIADETISIGSSIGIAIFPHHGQQASELMQHADVAMYRAKFTSVDFCIYTEELGNINHNKIVSESSLRHAIENGELILHFQPKVDFDSDHIHGVEALVRWQHQKHGLVFPDDFIPLAEQSGLIKPLTLSVLRMALHQCAEWKKNGMTLSMAVNVSALDLVDKSFPDNVAQILQENDVAPELLELEITETGVMTHPTLAVDVIRRLSKMGIQISIDDFGTGYSSMAYLKKLLVAKIKIDKSFVMDMIKNKNDATIVRAIIDLGHNLGLKVIAEGIEDKPTWEQLKRLGCDVAQGYYLGRPVLANELTGMLKKSISDK